MPENYKDVVVEFYNAYASGDLNRLLVLLHPELECRASETFIYADQNPYLGPDGFRRILEKLAGDWEVFQVIPEEIQAAGDLVIARGRYLGTYKATGDHLNAEFVHVFKFKDNKIILQHNYTDTAQFRDVVGAAARTAGGAGEG